MFKVDVLHINKPYLHVIFEICCDTLSEAEILATKHIRKHFGCNTLQLVYNYDLEYFVCDGDLCVGDVYIRMLD